VREFEAVRSLADLTHVRAVLIELKDARWVAAGIDVDVALRVAGHADPLAEILPDRHLAEGTNVGRNFWPVCGLWLVLGEDRACDEHDREGDPERQAALHKQASGTG